MEQLNVIIDQNDAVIQKLQQENNQLSEQLSIAQSTLANQQEDIKNITEYATAKEQENVQLTEQIKQLQEYIQQIQNAENQPIVSETENNKVENTKTQTTSKTKNNLMKGINKCQLKYYLRQEHLKALWRRFAVEQMLCM